MDVARRKERLRGELERRRRRVSADASRAAGEAVARRVAALPGIGGCARLVLYASLAEELPTGPLARWGEANGLPLLWPRVVGRRLEFCVAAPEALVPGVLGIPEPPSRIAPEVPGVGDWWVIPGVAFDVECRRLGRGGGFYDRALAGRRGPVCIGVGYDFQCIDEVPVAPHDQPLDWVVTDARELAAPANREDP